MTDTALHCKSKTGSKVQPEYVWIHSPVYYSLAAGTARFNSNIMHIHP